jgi:hypothetical protein
VTGAAAEQRHDVLVRIVLGDLLDDAILGARPGDKSFPLRVFFGELGARAGEPSAFVLACGLNFFFRAAMEDEDKVRIGWEVSRLYYAFTKAAEMDERSVRETSPLLAALMSSDLGRVVLESVDHVAAFDSQFHEREAGSDTRSAKIARPASFLAKVAANDRVRLKARVVT